MTFPKIKGKTVNGERRTLPEDFEGHYQVVVLAFTKYQQADVDSWMPFLNNLKRHNSQLQVYEVPVIERMFFFKRMLLDTWMYNGIDDPDVRNRTITLYTNVSEFLKSLNLTHIETIYTLLMDNQGTVYWRGSGPYNENRGSDLMLKLRLLEPQSAQSGA
ncbi:MAG: hypothetical protein CL607_21760 [Anaerolineaceae bacterium]|nr:hypothetical protein [Anaerolineaceae bacterium]